MQIDALEQLMSAMGNTQNASGFSRMPEGTQYLQPDGTRPTMRSESTVHEKARRDMPAAPTIFNHLTNPQLAELLDAIRRRDAQVMQSTGPY